MPYQKNEFRKDLFVHIFNRGNNKAIIFKDNSDYTWFLSKVKGLGINEVFSTVAYALMPNHFHFYGKVIKEDSISKFMQRLLLAYAKYFNNKYNHTGHVYEGPFKSVPIKNNEHALYLGKYIHLNPIKGRLVKRPEEWKFSNYQDVIGMRNGSLVDREFYVEYYKSIQEYISFINDGDDTYEDKIKQYLWD